MPLSPVTLLAAAPMKKRRLPRLTHLCLLLLLPFTVSCKAADEDDFEASIIKVIDGDSLIARKPDKTEIELRVEGIDAPEWKQPGGKAAQRAMEKLVLHKKVKISVVEIDKHDRAVAWITRLDDNKLINVEMVRIGWAWWYEKYAPDHKQLKQAEAEALKSRRGLWGLKERTPPWLYRRAFPRPKEKPPITGYWLNTETDKRHNSNCRYYKKGTGRECKKDEGDPCGLCGG